MAVKISALEVKTLREQTGAGMMVCKKALVEAQGDFAKAQEIIVKAGYRKAEKSASRLAAEGLMGISLSADNKKGALIEVNCETDFVARDATFVKFVKDLSQVLLETGQQDVEVFLGQPIDGFDTVDSARKALAAKIGENINIRRVAYFVAGEGETIGAYLHGVKIGVLVRLQGGDKTLAQDIAMHIAGMSPKFISPNDVSEEVIVEEKSILLARAKKSGKPENILDKIVQGQMIKFLNEISLTGQSFLKDPERKIEELLSHNKAKVLEFIRFMVGEGIEVKKMSFQEEVMAQAKQEAP